jgi:hypothetical protein
MIKFFVRLSILIIAIIITVSFVAGLKINSLIVAFVFMAMWITIVSLDDVLWWLLAFAILFGILHYDNTGLNIVLLITLTSIFNIIYTYLRRTANDGFLVVFVVIFLLSLVGLGILNLILYQNFLMNFYDIAINFIVVFVATVVFGFCIKVAEKFINLYTYGTDMRRHM